MLIFFYLQPEEHERALVKLHGVKVGDKHIVVRPANKVNYEELERPKPKIEIPALTVGTSSKSSADKTNTQLTAKDAAIRALEAKLKQLESNKLEFDFNKSTTTNEPPLIQKYQYNKDKPPAPSKPRYTHNRSRHRPSRPYDRHR